MSRIFTAQVASATLEVTRYESDGSVEISIEDTGNLCTDNGYNGDMASIVLTSEQVAALVAYLEGTT